MCVCAYLLRLLFFFRAHSKQTKIPRIQCFFFSSVSLDLVENISKQLLCATIDKNVFNNKGRARLRANKTHRHNQQQQEMSGPL